MLSRLVDIRSGEGKRALLAFACLMLVISSYTVVKAVRDALFLSRFGITQLSFIAIGLAVGIGFVITIYLRATAGLPRNRLMWSTNVTIAGTLVLIWVGLFSPRLAALLPWVLYIWSSVFGVFIVMQFWLLANDLFDPREAKRLFGFVGAGAILGGISGGFLSRSLASLMGTSNLLLLAAGMLLLEAVLVSMVWPLRRREEARPRRTREKRPAGGGLTVVKDNKMVRLLALAVLSVTVATTLLDWQFKGIAKAHFAGRTDEMAGFFGALYGWLSVASFVIQGVFTSVILRRFGVGVGLLLLPVSLLAGSALILAHTVIPGLGRLTAASVAKIADGGLRFSVDKASMELMWLPVPPRIKEQGKSFVDTVVDRFGTGVTGFIWLALAAIGLDAPGRIHLVSLAVIGVVALWLLVILRARSAYLGSLREALTDRRLDLDRSMLNPDNAEVQRTLAPMLASEDPREAHFALYLAREMSGALPDLSPLLGHADVGVRNEALRLLIERQDPGCRQAAVECLAHPDDILRARAVSYLVATSPPAGDPLLDQLSGRPDVDSRTVDVIKLGLPAHAMSAADQIRRALEAAGPEDQLPLLRMLAAAPPEMAAALLAAPLRSEHPPVVREAILAAGRARAEKLVPRLAGLLPDRRHRKLATAALRSIGAPAVDHLAALLSGGGMFGPAAQAMTQVLGGSRRPDVAPLLLDLLEQGEFSDAHRALRALNRLRNSVGLELDAAGGQRVRGLVDRELDALYRDLLFLGHGSWADLHQAPRSEALLVRALADRADDRIERAFRLLALGQDPADIYAAYLGVRSPLKSVRASSIEFLDNVLPRDVAASLLPLLESLGPRRFAATARQQGSGEGEEQREQVLRRLLGERDGLLQAAAAYTAGSERVAPLAADLRGLVDQAGAPLDAVAARALQRLEAQHIKEPIMGLTVIEKALKLQQADVLEQASTEDLHHIAQIATEEELPPGSGIYGEGDAPDALFVIISGKVKLHRGEEDIDVLGEGEAFGGWALVDESPRVASASTVEQSTLLKVHREEFMELLADRVDIAQAVFKAMARRLRRLADISAEPPPADEDDQLGGSQ